MFRVRLGMGFRDAVVNPVATSLQTMMRLGIEVPPWVGRPGRRCYSVCHLLDSVRWAGIPPWVAGVKRTVHFAELGLPALGETFNHAGPQLFPRGQPFEELGSTLGGQSNMGGHSESYARSYASDPESRDGTLQVSRAGNAGKSLTTPISIQPWQRRHQGNFG